MIGLKLRNALNIVLRRENHILTVFWSHPHAKKIVKMPPKNQRKTAAAKKKEADQSQQLPQLSKVEEKRILKQQRAEIIEHVSQYPQIYDKSHALYKHTDINGPLLEEIGLSLIHI